MKINLKNGLKEFENRYSFFHDGFLKAIEVSSGNHFRQEMEWEKPKQYKTNEERLLDTGMVIDESDEFLCRLDLFSESEKLASKSVFFFRCEALDALDRGEYDATVG